MCFGTLEIFALVVFSVTIFALTIAIVTTRANAVAAFYKAKSIKLEEYLIEIARQ